MEPHPDYDEPAEAHGRSRGATVATVVIAVLLVAIVVLHLAGAMSLHS